MDSQGYRSRLDTGVNNIGYTIVRLAPIIAPIPALATLLDATNYAVYAWFVVLGVELTGYAIGEQSVKAIRLGVFSLRNLVWALTVYGVIIEGLMLGYKVLPAWAEWHAGIIDLSHAIQSFVGVLYPAFTLAGAVLFAFHEYLEEVQADRDHTRAQQRQRNEEDVADNREFHRMQRRIELDAMQRKMKQDAELEREKAMAAIRIKEKKAMQKPDSSESKVNQGDSDKRIVLDFYALNPLANQREAADSTGVSQSKISRMLKKLESSGVIHRNGNGVEILEN